MTHAGIECFLAVCRHKTGIKAAQALYITQSSLSTRLKTLERELGGPLFHRKKGCREMTLTAAGKEFYALAVQYEALMEQMRQVCRRQPGSLRVSSFNSLGTYLLPAVYERFMQKYPQISLEIQDMELEAASRSLQSGSTDLAFTTGRMTDSLLVQTPVFSEPMVLICGAHADYPEPVTLEKLSIRHEVYIAWSSRFARWHQRTFGTDAQPQISISIMTHLRRFMEREQCWAIVPVSVADGLTQDSGVRRLEAAFPLPWREVSCLTAAGGGNGAAIQAFYECLREVISAAPELELLL